MQDKVTAADVIRALDNRYKNYPYLGAPEVQAPNRKRLDYWVIAPNDKYVGFEVKVNRSDFLQDDKWEHYLQMCTHFYFVCPKGLIAKEELPDEIGLIYYNPAARVQKLRQVKEAKPLSRHGQGINCRVPDSVLAEVFRQLITAKLAVHYKLYREKVHEQAEQEKKAWAEINERMKEKWGEHRNTK
jgi:hypothetical protein